ncbi:putative 5-formyltetrahydrofolate cyclo-ligase [Gammaproteobacteria bacterium MOLA455]|nr:putative 5-formyltetrahydrofolate cyclo-ligase [Gammaproteobacteria bacterium MOLA455]
MNPSEIRKSIREKRRALNPSQQRTASEQLAKLVCRQDFFQRAKRIGIYLANDGEIDPTPIINAAFRAKKACFLPLIDPLKANSLHFAEYQYGDTLHKNRFGILEPQFKSTAITPPWSLDLILVPLVAFDRGGNRLGMGGGFYDRTLAPRPGKPSGSKLIGLAHQLQEVAGLTAESWDIPLHKIATDQEIICARLK